MDVGGVATAESIGRAATLSGNRSVTLLADAGCCALVAALDDNDNASARWQIARVVEAEQHFACNNFGNWALKRVHDPASTLSGMIEPLYIDLIMAITFKNE